MSTMQVFALLVAGVSGTAVVAVRDVVHQAIVFGFYGLALALVFLVFQAPDAAMAQVIVSGMIVPLLVLVALAKIRKVEP